MFYGQMLNDKKNKSIEFWAKEMFKPFKGTLTINQE